MDVKDSHRFWTFLRKDALPGRKPSDVMHLRLSYRCYAFAKWGVFDPFFVGRDVRLKGCSSWAPGQKLAELAGRLGDGGVRCGHFQLSACRMWWNSWMISWYQEVCSVYSARDPTNPISQAIRYQNYPKLIVSCDSSSQYFHFFVHTRI